MDGDINIRSLLLSSLPYGIRRLLCLLDTPKIIRSDGPDNILRDWRGMAFLANISQEMEAIIRQYEDKTYRVLAKWLEQDPSATVGQLLDNLARMDRFDVYDDICAALNELISQGEISMSPHVQLVNNNNIARQTEDALITLDDRPGYVQWYHAFVLYAKEDQDFVDELLRRLAEAGFQICTVDRLLPGHSTQYAPVARVISERCQRIILVYSPEFLSSLAMTYYSNYAQAVSIESKLPIIPIMYRDCQLPNNLAHYHNLYYNRHRAIQGYDFWQSLIRALPQAPYTPRINGYQQIAQPVNGFQQIAFPTSSYQQSARPINDFQQLARPINGFQQIAGPINGYQQAARQHNGLLAPPSPMRIMEMPSTPNLTEYLDEKKFLPSTHSMECLTVNLKTDDCTSLSSQISSTSEGKKKKPSSVKKFFMNIGTIVGKKPKKDIPVAN